MAHRNSCRRYIHSIGNDIPGTTFPLLHDPLLCTECDLWLQLTRSKGLHQRTSAMVQRIVILTMETNCLSGIDLLLERSVEATHFVTLAVLAIVALVLFFALGVSVRHHSYVEYRN